MNKTPPKPRKDEAAPSEDDVLRRMLNTPPKPHKPKPDTDGDTAGEAKKNKPQR